MSLVQQNYDAAMRRRAGSILAIYEIERGGDVDLALLRAAQDEASEAEAELDAAARAICGGDAKRFTELLEPNADILDP
jgi:hypothetical protein